MEEEKNLEEAVENVIDDIPEVEPTIGKKEQIHSPILKNKPIIKG